VQDRCIGVLVHADAIGPVSGRHCGERRLGQVRVRHNDSIPFSRADPFADELRQRHSRRHEKQSDEKTKCGKPPFQVGPSHRNSP